MTLRIQASSGGCAMRAPGVAQGHALQVRHHHVGGGVVLPEAVDLDQRRMVEAGEQARLVDERAQADRVGLGERARAHRDLRPGAARRERRRHVFLERHLALERMVVGQIDDAEAADAEHAQDLELAEARARRQRVVVGSRRQEPEGWRRRVEGCSSRLTPARPRGGARAYRRPLRRPATLGRGRAWTRREYALCRARILAANHGHHPPAPSRRPEGRHRLLRRPRHQRRAALDAQQGRDSLRLHRQPRPARRARLRRDPAQGAAVRRREGAPVDCRASSSPKASRRCSAAPSTSRPPASPTSTPRRSAAPSPARCWSRR